MSQITGTGCMLGMICATYLAGSDPFSAAVWAAVEFGLAGEKAAKKSKGPGSFQTELLDCFFLLTEKEIQEELGDMLFVLICFANSLNIDLEEAHEMVMNKFKTRDKDRWTKIEEEMGNE